MCNLFPNLFKRTLELKELSNLLNGGTSLLSAFKKWGLETQPENVATVTSIIIAKWTVSTVMEHGTWTNERHGTWNNMEHGPWNIIQQLCFSWQCHSAPLSYIFSLRLHDFLLRLPASQKNNLLYCQFVPINQVKKKVWLGGNQSTQP